MERLSKRFMYYCGLLATKASVDDLKHIQNLIDAEEQGLLVKLPCKVGDTVYVKLASAYCDLPYAEAEIVNFSHFTSCGFCVVIASNHFDIQSIPFSEFGKKIFLTKEEAEQALKQIKTN